MLELSLLTRCLTLLYLLVVAGGQRRDTRVSGTRHGRLPGLVHIVVLGGAVASGTLACH